MSSQLFHKAVIFFPHTFITFHWLFHKISHFIDFCTKFLLNQNISPYFHAYLWQCFTYPQQWLVRCRSVCAGPWPSRSCRMPSTEAGSSGASRHTSGSASSARNHPGRYTMWLQSNWHHGIIQFTIYAANECRTVLHGSTWRILWWRPASYYWPMPSLKSTAMLN